MELSLTTITFSISQYAVELASVVFKSNVAFSKIPLPLPEPDPEKMMDELLVALMHSGFCGSMGPVMRFEKGRSM